MNTTFALRNDAPRLRLLGLSEHGADTDAHGRLGQKPLILLTRLVIEPRPVAREALMAFLWPEASESRARGSLRQALHVLRDIVGHDNLVADRRAVGLRSAPPSDLGDFLHAVRSNDWRGAALAYRGPLLEGVAVADATDAELWLDFERRRIGKLFETVAVAALEERRISMTPAERLDVGRRLREHNPRHLKAWRFVLDELSASGDMCTLRMERAALGARIETGQIDDPRAATQLLDESFSTAAVA